ncbi:pentatricopeptide repeat-containing protein At2g18520, mitochondrial-like isoform X2 [Arachis hypogaea]|uniref:pentatricopeptide repeat-containing protein At2g18520, mitochondrial-like isoform X2 n=1 Tax=Arachis hypogaea TaxID=3818 RepID=UPI003B219FC0
MMRSSTTASLRFFRRQSESQFGNVDYAIWFLDHMDYLGYQPDSHTFGAIINGLCKMGDTPGAIAILRRTETRKCKPSVNAVGYNAIVDSLCKDGLLSEALSLFSEMTTKGLQPDTITYNHLIQGLYFQQMARGCIFTE